MRIIVSSFFSGIKSAALWLALGIALMLASIQSADSAEQRPLLREQIQVFNNVVTLGDLFDNAGISAGVAVFRSPDLGTTGIVAAKRISSAARRHGLNWINPGELTKITVERPSRLISLDEIKEAITRRAIRKLGLENDNNLTVELDIGAKPFHVTPRLVRKLQIKRMDIRTTSGLFSATIGFTEASYGVRDRRVSGRAFESVQVVVPVRTLDRGATIESKDIKILSLPKGRISSSVMGERVLVIGMATTRRLGAGRPIRSTDLEKPKLVKRNTLVTIIYELPGLSLRLHGKAMASGAKGEVISVMNTRSKRLVEAIVNRPGVVTIQTSKSRLMLADVSTASIK